MERTFQEGIFFRAGEVPGKFFAISFLEPTANAKGASVRDCLAALWPILQGLRRGVVPELPGGTVPASGLTCLIGYGPNCFKLPGTKSLPDGLRPQHRFLSPRTSGGGPLLVGSGLEYAADVFKNVATEAVMLQFIADTQLAVSRAVVEVEHFLATYRNDAIDSSPLAMAGFFTGFQREDHRSWIGFHDGISNLRSGKEREGALAIPTGDYEMGSYFTFIRLAVDLSQWRKIDMRSQELLVGRDKLTGCAFRDVAPDGTPLVVPGCPLVGTMDISQPGNELFREPPLVGHPQLLESHVQRANLQHNQNTRDPQSLRIFRQGYEFLEEAGSPSKPRVGLNFVAFQSTPSRVIGLLTRDRWLGGTNFGGPVGADGTRQLLSVRAAATFLVPPTLRDERFPGEQIFGT